MFTPTVSITPGTIIIISDTSVHTCGNLSGERHTAVGKAKVNEVLTYRGVRLSYIFCGKVYFVSVPCLRIFFTQELKVGMINYEVTHEI